MLFHVHDGRRRRREACHNSEVSRRLSAGLEGELYHLASGADAEFPCPTYPIPDCKLSGTPTVEFVVLTILSAFCILCRNRLDRLPFTYQLLRRGLDVVGSSFPDAPVRDVIGAGLSWWDYLYCVRS